MRLVEYTPDHFDLLRRAAERMDVGTLRHRPFVDHYYASSPWCKLYLAMADAGTIGGTIGVELMPFEHERRPLTLGFGTNFHSLLPGCGGYLFMRLTKSCDAGLAFGGTADTHRILKQQKWVYFQGIKTCYLNHYMANPGEAAWRVAAKWVIRHVSPRKDLRKRVRQIERAAGKPISVVEESDYSGDLLPQRSPFTLRFAPSPDYLHWRYNTRLSFVRYRLFRILESGRTAGYVILNDAPNQLMVAHCDGDDPATLASGVLLSLAEAGRHDEKPRKALLTVCHPVMWRIYQQFGFVTRGRWDRSLALGLRRNKITLPPDTSNWLVNFDWGDNGLRVPFLDQI